MKKPTTYVSIIFILSLLFSLSVYAETKGDSCDPKKIDACCNKIQKLVPEIDALKARLEKLHAELQKNKKLTVGQADRTYRTLEDIESFLKNDEVQDFGLED
jgi:peptidoglycan hydrolase CwlO-like protein